MILQRSESASRRVGESASDVMRCASWVVRVYEELTDGVDSCVGKIRSDGEGWIVVRREWSRTRDQGETDRTWS